MSPCSERKRKTKIKLNITSLSLKHTEIHRSAHNPDPIPWPCFARLVDSCCYVQDRTNPLIPGGWYTYQQHYNPPPQDQGAERSTTCIINLISCLRLARTQSIYVHLKATGLLWPSLLVVGVNLRERSYCLHTSLWPAALNINDFLIIHWYTVVKYFMLCCYLYGARVISDGVSGAIN